MAHDKATAASGAPPDGGGHKLRPTVIGAPEKAAGRASSGRAASEGRPVPPARPTVIDKLPGRPGIGRHGSLEQRAAPARPMTVAMPTAVPGVERKRMTVALADIRKLAPGVSPQVAERTRQLLQGLVLEGLKDREAVMWGHELQQDYSDLVSESLALTQHDLCKRVTGHAQRMAELLGSVDVRSLCDSDTAGGLGQYLRKANRRVDTFEEFEAVRLELSQLVTLMGDALEPLLGLKATLEQHSRRIDNLAVEAEAYALAAEVASSYLRQNQQALSQRLLERGMSLTQTAVQIRSSAPMREIWVKHPLHLIGVIQNGVLVQVPQWLGSIASLNVLQQRRNKPTPTQAEELAYQLRNILQLLNT